jgi:hypothetical protein
MDFELDDKLRALQETGAELGKRCRGATPAIAGEDWRTLGAKELMRGAGITGAAIFLDAYAANRGTLRAARSHADDVIAKAPDVLEAVLLAGGLQGLILEVVENVRLPADLRNEGLPTEKDPDVRRGLADAKTQSLLARNQALRAAWVVDVGTPTSDVKAAPLHALAFACDAVLATWAPLSRLIIGDEAYAMIESDLFRFAARRRPEVFQAVADLLLGERTRREGTGTSELAADRKGVL